MDVAGTLRASRRAIAGFAMLFVLVVWGGGLAPAHAATLTYSDAQCAAFTISPGGSAGSFVLNCAKLSCTLTSSAGNSISPLNTPTTLTAACTPGADTYAWSAGSANSPGCPALPGGSSVMQALTPSGQSAAVAGCVYQVDATSAANGGGSATITLGWSSAPPPPPPSAPTGCVATLTTTPLSLTSAGGTANLNVSGCSGAVTSYAWTRNTTPNVNSSASWSDPLPANSLATPVTTSYQVSVCNGTACATFPAAPLTATVPGASTGPSTNLCFAHGYSKTIYYQWDWSGPLGAALDTAYMTDQAGSQGLGANGILVVEFTPTPPIDVYNSLLVPSVRATGYPAPNLMNQLTLAVSTQPCDINPAPPGATTSTGPNVNYWIGTVPTYWATGQKVALELVPGTKYYINVASRQGVSASNPDGTNTCVSLPAGWNCDVRLSLQKPAGH